MPEQITREEFEELLDAYVSAARLGVLDATIERRQKLIEAFEAKQLGDGEFRLEGNLFGAWLHARGRMKPRQYRNPEAIAAFMGELVEGMLNGIGEVLDDHKRRSDAAGGN